MTLKLIPGHWRTVDGTLTDDPRYNAGTDARTVEQNESLRSIAGINTTRLCDDGPAFLAPNGVALASFDGLTPLPGFLLTINNDGHVSENLPCIRSREVLQALIDGPPPNTDPSLVAELAEAEPQADVDAKRAAFQNPEASTYLAPDAPVIPESSAPIIPPIPFAATDTHPLDDALTIGVVHTIAIDPAPDAAAHTNTLGVATIPASDPLAVLPPDATIVKASATVVRISWVSKLGNTIRVDGERVLHALHNAWEFLTHNK